MCYILDVKGCDLEGQGLCSSAEANGMQDQNEGSQQNRSPWAVLGDAEIFGGVSAAGLDAWKAQRAAAEGR